LDRREFIKKTTLAGIATSVAATGAGTLINGMVKASSQTGFAFLKEDDRPKVWVMIIDLGKCIGCGACLQSCQAAHFVPFNQEWIKIYELEDAFNEKFFFPRPCMNCQKAPCVRVCPVGANFYDEDRNVLINQKRCIGCRMCMAACPYDARSFNWTEPEHTPEELDHEWTPQEPWPHMKGVVEKCDWCTTHTVEGMLPPCISACPTGTIYFGNFREDAVTNGLGATISITEIFRNRQPYRYKEELGTKPSVYYLSSR
jgi:molybdopterin-containing oxidoreductase family iron-sulfur binding subunit